MEWKLISALNSNLLLPLILYTNCEKDCWKEVKHRTEEKVHSVRENFNLT